jgi:iron complex transport system substrate-binding protein
MELLVSDSQNGELFLKKKEEQEVSMSGKDKQGFFLDFQKQTLGIVLTLIIMGCCCFSGCTNTHNNHNMDISYSNQTSIHFTDSANHSFSLAHPAERIVTINADTVETLIVLGAGDKIIGVADNVAKNPQFMGHLPNAKIIGSSENPNIELISSLHPDVIVVMSSSPDNIKARLETLNLTVAVFDCYILSDLQFSVKNLGIMTGKTDNADKYLLFFQSYDSLIRERIRNISTDQQPSVYFEISDYTAAGKGSGGSSLLWNIKATNIAEELPTPWPIVSPEWIVKSNPDVIIKSVHSYAGDEKKFPDLNNEIRARQGFSDMNAVKNDRVYVISSNILYGPRGIIGQLYLGKIFYPDRFSDINPDSVLHQYAKDYMSDADITATVYPR